MAIGTGTSIAKWSGHKAQCHMTSLLSDGSPGCCHNSETALVITKGPNVAGVLDKQASG